MCGITGIISEDEFFVKEQLLGALKKLEYRGYDSAGFAILNGYVLRRVGEIKNLEKETNEELTTTCGIAHTRWATHGGVSERNAHPFADNDNKLFLVHNGIIENSFDMKKELMDKGYSFESETDTEVIVNFLSEELKKSGIHNAIKSFISKAKGTYAVVFFIKGENTLYALKKDSPLCLGITNDEMIVASDVFAFSHLTNKVIFFDDNEYAVIKPKEYRFYNLNGEITKDVRNVVWEDKPVEKDKFEHFMIKEIYEEPNAIQRDILSLRTVQKKKIEKLAGMVKESKRVLFLASGTSYHASLIGSYLLSRLGYEAHAVISSEFENFSIIDEDTLIIAVSQSGETMDLISVLKRVLKFDPKLVSIVNFPYSTIYRMSEVSIEISAGQEICVAATKTFVNTLIVLFELAKTLNNHISLDKIPEKVKDTIELNKDKVVEIAGELKDERDIFVLGNKITYPLAREFALKLKEICYIHAEGMMAGELKHGTIALIEDGIPVFGLIHNSNKERMESALGEVKARGAKIYKIGGINSDFKLPEKLSEEECSVCLTTIGYLITYHIARLKGLSIDKPRNLAKSVTVK